MDNLEVRIENEMLRGNINRMFLTHDIEELNEMLKFAKLRIERIYDFHYARIVNDN